MSNSKLIILSERNTLAYLENKGIKPSEFYTDYATFKERLPFFKNVTIVIIFSGACSFSQKRVLDSVAIINNRLVDEYDTSIDAFYVLSDYTLSACKKYYKYDYEPKKFIEYSGKKIVSKEEIDIWSKLDYEEATSPTRVFLETASYTSALESVKTKQIGTDGRANKLIIPRWIIHENSDNDLATPVKQ